jgi:hypothetical protein
MSLSKFKASPLPTAPMSYSQSFMSTMIRNIETYFRQLDSRTAEEAASYTAPQVITTAVTVAELPTASTVPVGTRMFVSDSNSTTFNAVVAGGGANKVPIFSDGSSWRIG